MRLKFCGLRSETAVVSAVDAGAAYIGFVFFPASPRNVTPEQALALSAHAGPDICKVGLMVNPSDQDLDRILAIAPLDMIQLHGGESPDRVTEVRRMTGLPVMKAVGLRDAEDLDRIDDYAAVADQVLVDAKPPSDGALPGGNGLSFDWRLLQGRRWIGPWMLAGGLTPDNVAEAARLTGATQVDVSSGVESAPGVKDPALVAAFAAAAAA